MVVELEIDDFTVLMRWFELAFAGKNPDKLPFKDRKVFWKLTFLCEDKIKEEKELVDNDEDKGFKP